MRLDQQKKETKQRTKQSEYTLALSQQSKQHGESDFCEKKKLKIHFKQFAFEMGWIVDTRKSISLITLLNAADTPEHHISSQNQPFCIPNFQSVRLVLSCRSVSFVVGEYRDDKAQGCTHSHTHTHSTLSYPHQHRRGALRPQRWARH